MIGEILLGHIQPTTACALNMVTFWYNYILTNSALQFDHKKPLEMAMNLEVISLFRVIHNYKEHVIVCCALENKCT